jgi:hypothetical protein
MWLNKADGALGGMARSTQIIGSVEKEALLGLQ